MVTFIGGDISIQGNDALTGLAGLGSLTYIGGNLNISYNSVLTSLTGLDALNSIIGNLSINNNPHLVSLTGLGANTSIGGGLYIQNNEELISCEIQSICDYLAIPGNTAEIFGNAFGCSSLGQIQNACGILVTCLDSIFFNSQAEIDAYPIDYPGCNTVIGNVIISGSDIINLNGLNQINTIEGNLTIAENDALTSLMGLNMVSFIGGNLWISGNNVLTDLTGLGSVASIGGTPYC
jgi:hypothetical protein